MRVLELSLRNYRVFEEVDLELPARVIGIFGPNGGGKSTLLDAVRYGLYGETRTDKKQIRMHGLLTDAAVRVVFEHGGAQYEVRRRIKGKNHTAEAELFVADRQLATGVTDVNHEVQRLLRMDQKVFRASVFAEQKQLDAFSEVRAGERKEMVLRLLGIRPVDVARAAARREARDLAGDAARLEGSLPDLAEQEARLERDRAEASGARERASAARQALEDAGGRARDALAAFEESDLIRQRVEIIAAERASLEERAEAHARREAHLAARIEQLADAVVELPGIEGALAELEGAAERFADGRRAEELSAELAQLEERLADVPEIDAEAELVALQEAQAERDAARDAATRARGAEERAGTDLALAEATLARATEADPAEPCPTCGRQLGEDFREYLAHSTRAVTVAKKEMAAVRKERRDRETALKAAEAALREAADRGRTAQEIVERRRQLDDRLADGRARLEPLLEMFGGSPPDLDQLRSAAAREQELRGRLAELAADAKRLEEARTDREAEREELRSCRDRLAQLDLEAGALAFDAEDHDRVRKERDEAALLLEQARVEEREARDALAALEREVAKLEGLLEQARETAARATSLRDDARYLDRTGVLLDGFRDHLVGRIGPELSREAQALFRELTAGEYDDLRIDEETLAIQIADGAEYFPIERFSGSEVDLANLALRVAISKHLSYMSGTDIGLLVLDEVLASLDVERKDLFVQAMGRLSAHFHQLFVITHAEQVKDQFQAVIEVRKVGQRRSVATLA